MTLNSIIDTKWLSDLTVNKEKPNNFIRADLFLNFLWNKTIRLHHFKNVKYWQLVNN